MGPRRGQSTHRTGDRACGKRGYNPGDGARSGGDGTFGPGRRGTRSRPPHDLRVDRAFKAFFRRVKRGEDAGYSRANGPGRYESMVVPRSREFKLRGDGQSRYGRLSFKGMSGMRVRMHRPLPEGAAVRRVIVKGEPSGHIGTPSSAGTSKTTNRPSTPAPRTPWRCILDSSFERHRARLWVRNPNGATDGYLAPDNANPSTRPKPA